MRVFKFLAVTVILLIVILIGVGLYIRSYYYNAIDEQNSDSPEVVSVEITAGEDIKSIATKLKDKGLIKNSDLFYWYVRIEKIGSKIQAGNFNIPTNLSMKEVAEVIQKAAGDDVWIRFQEGLRGDEIAEILEIQFLQIENTQFSKIEFLDIVYNPDNYDLNSSLLRYKPAGNSLEGFIYPDTYSVRVDISTKEVVELFLQTFEEKITQQNTDKLEETEEGFYNSIVLASIVEREGRNDEERKRIADILLSRLREGLEDGTKLLQADATLLYLQKDWETPVTQELKAMNDPYNTYINPGLPPTPISNPGLESIMAVVNPVENEYLYYLHGNDGEIRYARSFTEHENNVRCYINENESFCP